MKRRNKSEIQCVTVGSNSTCLCNLPSYTHKIHARCGDTSNSISESTTEIMYNSKYQITLSGGELHVTQYDRDNYCVVPMSVEDFLQKVDPLSSSDSLWADVEITCEDPCGTNKTQINPCDVSLTKLIASVYPYEFYRYYQGAVQHYCDEVTGGSLICKHTADKYPIGPLDTQDLYNSVYNWGATWDWGCQGWYNPTPRPTPPEPEESSSSTPGPEPGSSSSVESSSSVIIPEYCTCTGEIPVRYVWAYRQFSGTDQRQGFGSTIPDGTYSAQIQSHFGTYMRCNANYPQYTSETPWTPNVVVKVHAHWEYSGESAEVPTNVDTSTSASASPLAFQWVEYSNSETTSFKDLKRDVLAFFKVANTEPTLPSGNAGLSAYAAIREKYKSSNTWGDLHGWIQSGTPETINYTRQEYTGSIQGLSNPQIITSFSSNNTYSGIFDLTSTLKQHESCNTTLAGSSKVISRGLLFLWDSSSLSTNLFRKLNTSSTTGAYISKLDEWETAPSWSYTYSWSLKGVTCGPGGADDPGTGYFYMVLTNNANGVITIWHQIAGATTPAAIPGNIGQYSFCNVGSVGYQFTDGSNVKIFFISTCKGQTSQGITTCKDVTGSGANDPIYCE